MTSDWAGQMAALFDQAEATPPGPDRAAVLCRIAEIQERPMADPGGALSVLEMALAEAPDSGRVIAGLERIARNNGLWTELVAMAAEVARGLADPRAAADLWVQIAFWNETGRAQLDEAVGAAEAALELQPAHGGALAMLANLHRRLRRWDRYVRVLEQRRDLLGLEAAPLIEGLREVLRYEPRHTGALDGLARALEEAGDWVEARDLLRRLIELLPEGAEQVAARHRLAALLAERLAEPRPAEEQLLLAVASPAGARHLPSLLLLASIYRRRSEWLKALQMLARAAEAAGDPVRRARFLGEAAEICAVHLDDEAQAAELYAAVLALDDTRDDLAEKLADLRERRGDLAGLLPLAERLAARAGGKPAAEQARWRHRLGRARAAAGDEAGALEAYRAAAGGDGAPASEAARAALEELASLAFRRQAWPDAVAAYARLATPAEADAAPREARLLLFERLGLARLRAGDARGAIEPLERAVALDPRRPDALAALVEAALAAEDDEAVVRHTPALVAVTADARTKLQLLQRVADIHYQRRNDPQRAIAAYFEALQIWPDERTILHRLLELLSETKQWKQAVQTLHKLAEITEGEARAPYLTAAAAILSDELASPREAIDALDEALDLTPRDPALWARLQRLAAGLGDARLQQAIARRQLDRLTAAPAPDDAPALLALWSALGDLARLRLDDHAGAVAALEAAVALAPDDVARRRVLADLYWTAEPPALRQAIVQHREIVARTRAAAELEPDVRALVRLFVETGALNDAHAAAGALVIAGRAGPEERALFEQYRPRQPPPAAGQLSEASWQAHLRHPDQDPVLSMLLAAVAPPVAAARARPAKELALKKKLRRDVARDPAPACRMLARAAQMLGVPLPEAYLAEDQPFELEVANVRGTSAAAPVVLIGRGMGEARPGPEAAFVAGRVAAWLRPEGWLRWPAFVATAGELAVVAAAALRAIDGAWPLSPELAAALPPYQALLAQISPQERERLSAVVRRYKASPPAAEDVAAVAARWARGAVFTAVRAGWLVAGDLEVASRLGQSFAAGAAIDPADVVRDLMAFSVSAGYADLRAELGIAPVDLAFRV
jgi:tetratricopeptide (TPR) repeat protein